MDWLQLVDAAPRPGQSLKFAFIIFMRHSKTARCTSCQTWLRAYFEWDDFQTVGLTSSVSTRRLACKPT